MINPSLEKDLLKIGRTTRKPDARASELCTTGVPARFHVAYEEEVEDCLLAESLLHQQLARYRYDQRREFFKLPLKAAIEIVRQVIASMPDKNELVNHDKLVDKRLLVARWSRFFQVLGIANNVVGCSSSEGEFVPDFWLPWQGCWIGVKGTYPNKEQRDKMLAFARSKGEIVFVLCNCAPIVMNGNVVMNSIQYFTPENEWDGCMEFGICPSCMSRHIGHFGSHNVDCRRYDTYRGCEYTGYDFTKNPLLNEAYAAANAIEQI